MPYAEVNGARIFYTDDGPRDATLVLLLHGMTCDSHDWSWQLPALAARFRVVAPDLVGHGRSDVRAGGYSLIELAADMASLLDQLGGRPAVVIGHSLGGVVAAALTVERPDLVLSVVGIDAGVQLPTPDLDAARALAARILGDEGTAVLRPYQGVVVEGEPEWMRTWRVRRLLGTQPHVVAGCHMALKDDPDGTPWMEYLSRRTRPVLALYRSSAVADLDATTLTHPESRTEIWPEQWGHWFHQQHSEAVNERLIAWIDQTDDRNYQEAT